MGAEAIKVCVLLFAVPSDGFATPWTVRTNPSSRRRLRGAEKELASILEEQGQSVEEMEQKMKVNGEVSRKVIVSMEIYGLGCLSTTPKPHYLFKNHGSN